LKAIDKAISGDGAQCKEVEEIGCVAGTREVVIKISGNPATRMTGKHSCCLTRSFGQGEFSAAKNFANAGSKNALSSRSIGAQVRRHNPVLPFATGTPWRWAKNVQE